MTIEQINERLETIHLEIIDSLCGSDNTHVANWIRLHNERAELTKTLRELNAN